ncbi:hypothetical protein SLEP1_g21614 [Rubroshorea leprosula]|uniref:Uncharacterized protein n=1 Tax=Rubroshorea leprosula TaxID=152421 RepID=A0AAV5JCM6_9ROSI|nr:hypothetical protein SLEP1_g21614 [Rubroshorea leprosula]
MSLGMNGNYADSNDVNINSDKPESIARSIGSSSPKKIRLYGTSRRT